MLSSCSTRMMNTADRRINSCAYRRWLSRIGVNYVSTIVIALSCFLSSCSVFVNIKDAAVEDFKSSMAIYSKEYFLQTQDFDFSINLVNAEKLPFGESRVMDRVSLQDPEFDSEYHNVSVKREMWNIVRTMGFVDTNIHIHRLSMDVQEGQPSSNDLAIFRAKLMEEEGDTLREPPLLFRVNDIEVIRFIYEDGSMGRFGIYYQIIASDRYLIGVSHSLTRNAVSKDDIPWLEEQVIITAEKMIHSITLTYTDNSSLFSHNE